MKQKSKPYHQNTTKHTNLINLSPKAYLKLSNNQIDTT